MTSIGTDDWALYFNNRRTIPKLHRDVLQNARFHDSTFLIVIVGALISPTLASTEYSYIDIYHDDHAGAHVFLVVSSIFEIVLATLGIALAIAFPATDSRFSYFQLADLFLTCIPSLAEFYSSLVAVGFGSDVRGGPYGRCECHWD